MDKLPNPGSSRALDLGCTCPRIDNAYGRGAWGSSGDEAIFVMREDCPLHAAEQIDCGGCAPPVLAARKGPAA